MDDSRNKNIDIRVIDLIKNTNGLLAPGNGGKEVYACIGHFEVMEVQKVTVAETQSPFEAIWDNLCSREDYGDERHAYPLYLLRNGNMDNFWALRYPCMVVSRVHLDQPPFQRKLNDFIWDCIQSIANDKSISLGSQPDDSKYYELKVDGNQVYCTYYQTLELGDIAVILKSCSLTACLTVAKSLMEHRAVGNVYSYCGLHRDLFLPKRMDEFSLKNNLYINSISDSDKKTEIKKALTKTLPYIMMRFSVHSSRLADSMWKELKIQNGIKFVAGTADAVADLSGKTCFDLIKIIRTLSAPPKCEDSPYTCCDAFDDIVTRIGINFGQISDNAKPVKDVLVEKEKGKAIQKTLITQIDEIAEVVREKEYDWYLPLLAQMKTLLTMMNNCVMDDLSLLIWPSVQAFIQRLYYILVKKQQTLSSEQLKDITAFLDGWATLSNDIVHLESQLVQNPRLQYPRVFVPASLLAFYMAFTYELNDLLIVIDKQSKIMIPDVRYSPLIAHSVDLRANTLCILDPGTDKEYKDDCPLLVSIPVSLMYSPDKVVSILCHECLHYAGEATRLREKRFESILYSCANIIISSWKLDGRGGSLVFEDFKREEERLEVIIKKKIDMLKKDNPSYVDLTSYIHLMREKLPDVLSEIFLDWQQQSQFISYTKNQQDKMLEYVGKFKPGIWCKEYVSIKELIDELLLLYKECYADIVTIRLLDLDVKGYLTNLYEREIRLCGKSENNVRKLHVLAAQAALVINSVMPRSVDDFPENVSEPFKTWYESVKQYRDLFQTGREDLIWSGKDENGNEVHFSFPCYEYWPLIDYLEECRKEIEKYLFRDAAVRKKVTDLGKLYRIVSQPDIDFDEFRQKIDQYHDVIKKPDDNAAAGAAS